MLYRWIAPDRAFKNLKPFRDGVEVYCTYIYAANEYLWLNNELLRKVMA